MSSTSMFARMKRAVEDKEEEEDAFVPSSQKHQERKKKAVSVQFLQHALTNPTSRAYSIEATYGCDPLITPRIAVRYAKETIPGHPYWIFVLVERMEIDLRGMIYGKDIYGDNVTVVLFPISIEDAFRNIELHKYYCFMGSVSHEPTIPPYKYGPVFITLMTSWKKRYFEEPWSKLSVKLNFEAEKQFLDLLYSKKSKTMKEMFMLPLTAPRKDH